VRPARAAADLEQVTPGGRFVVGEQHVRHRCALAVLAVAPEAADADLRVVADVGGAVSDLAVDDPSGVVVVGAGRAVGDVGERDDADADLARQSVEEVARGAGRRPAGWA
jgi:hypothetical protein